MKSKAEIEDRTAAQGRQGTVLNFALRAEEELAQAERATAEAARKRHYFKAAILLNLAFGGDPRPGGEKGLIY